MHEEVLVGEAVAGAAAKAMQQVEALIANINKQQFDLADALYTVKKNGYYQKDFATFKEYYQTLKIKARRAQYLTKIVETMTAVGISRQEYEPLGIGKLREITSLEPSAIYTNPVTGEQTPMKDWIVDLVEKGAEMDLEEIQKHVRTLKGLVGEHDIVFKNLAFTRQQVEKTIDPAIELTRANIGSVGKDEEGISKDASESACVEVWAVEYLNNPANNPMNQETGYAEETEATTDEAA